MIAPAAKAKPVLEELSRPFAPEAVRFRLDSKVSDKGARVVPYVDATTIIARLNHVLGLDWADSYRDVAGGVECTLIVEGHPRADVGEKGSGQAGSGPKAMYSDALKRAARKFGVGAFLYAFPKSLMFCGPDGLRNWKNSRGEVQYDLNTKGQQDLREAYRKWATAKAQLAIYGEIIGHGEVAADEEPVDAGEVAADAETVDRLLRDAPQPAKAPAANGDNGWVAMKALLEALQWQRRLDQWFVKTGYSKMTAAMWSALTPANRKLCMDWAERLLADAAVTA